MKSRIFFLAIVATIIGIFLLALHQRRFEAASSGGEKVKLLSVAKEQIERGTVLVDDMLSVREVPMAYVEDRAIKEAERGKVIGLRVVNLLRENETLMWTDLTSGEEQQPLSNAIQPGSRALTIRTSREDSNAPLIRPGDFVDVLSVMPDGRPEKSGQGESRSSVVLMQRVLVLASGYNISTQDVSDPAVNKLSLDKAESTLLTLSVTLQEAQILTLAAEKGRLSVVVRAKGDQRALSNVPEIPSDELWDVKLRTARAMRPSVMAGPLGNIGSRN